MRENPAELMLKCFIGWFRLFKEMICFIKLVSRHFGHYLIQVQTAGFPNVEGHVASHLQHPKL